MRVEVEDYIEICGEEFIVTLEIDYTPPTSGTYMNPPDPPEYDLVGIKVNNKEVAYQEGKWDLGEVYGKDLLNSGKICELVEEKLNGWE